MAKRKAILDDFTIAQKMYKSHPHISDLNLDDETLFVTFSSDGFTREFTASLVNYPETCTLYSDKSENLVKCTIPSIVKKIENDCLQEMANSNDIDNDINDFSPSGGSLRNSWRTHSTESYVDDQWEDEEEADSEEADENRYLQNKKLMKDVHAFRELYTADAITLRGAPVVETVFVEMLLYPYPVLSRVTAEAWGFSYTIPICIRVSFSDLLYTDTLKVSQVEVFQRDPLKMKKGGLAQLEYIVDRFVQDRWPFLKNDPLPEPKVVQKQEVTKKPTGNITSISNINSLVEMGFSRELATIALERSSSLDEAMTLLLEDPESLVYLSKFNEADTPKDPLQLFKDPTAAIRNQKNHGITINDRQGFLVMIYDYVQKRLPTLNNYCVVCDRPHVFATGSMLKPSVCSRELCCFSFQQLGVCANAADGIATEAEVVDLLVSMASVAANHPRHADIFEPFPLVFDDNKRPVITPQKKDIKLVTQILESFPSVEMMTQADDFAALKTQMDNAHKYAFPLLQWIITSNRSHIVRIPDAKHVKSMATPHQYLLLSAPPEKEEKFRFLKQQYGSVFAFHGSPIENWHCILRVGLKNYSGTKKQLNGAAHGAGIYLSPLASTSLSYTFRNFAGNSQRTTPTVVKNTSNKFLDTTRINCIALCEVINFNIRKNGSIWVQPEEDNVVTRFFFVYMGTSDQSAYQCNCEQSAFKSEIDRAMELVYNRESSSCF